MKTNIYTNILESKLLLKGAGITAVVAVLILFVNIGIACADVNYFVYDAPGRSVVQLVNPANVVNNTYEYDSFGNFKTATENVSNNYKYVGEQLDTETGLINLRNRYYDPQSGRFITKDLFSGVKKFPDTINPYPYCSNNPINSVDPQGLLYANMAPPSVIDAAFVIGGAAAGIAGEFLAKGMSGKLPSLIDIAGAAVGGAVGGEVLYRTGDPTIAGAAQGATQNLVTQGLNIAFVPGSSFNGGQFAASTLLGAATGWAGGKIGDAIAPSLGLGSTYQGAEGAVVTNLESSGQYSFLTSSNQVVQYTAESSLLSLAPGAVPDIPIAGESLSDSLADAFNASATSFGGVDLNLTATLLGNVQDFGGATYDQATGQIILYGQQNVSLPPMDLDDLSVAVDSEYGLNGVTPADPGVSIGTQPSSIAGQMYVGYFGAVMNTGFGQILFNSDRLLKSLTLGQDNITGQPVSVSVPGYEDMVNRYKAGGSAAFSIVQNNPIERMWFTPKQITLEESADGSSMEFSTAVMQLLTSASLTGTVETDPYSLEFAQEVTQDYDLYAAQFPILQQLTRLGKITSKWISETNFSWNFSAQGAGGWTLPIAVSSLQGNMFMGI